MAWLFFARLSATNSAIITSFLRKKGTDMATGISNNCSKKLGDCALPLKSKKGSKPFIIIAVNPVASSISAGAASIPRSTAAAGVRAS